MFTEEQIKEVSAIIEATPGKIYLGCDSIKYKKHGKWFARYAVVIVLHINSKNGCRIFSTIVREPDFDPTGKKPGMRLMREVYLVAECFDLFMDVLIDREIEIHLDVSPDKMHKSNAVASQACGYILGTCGVEPKIKPEAFAASYAADASCRGRTSWEETKGVAA